MPEAGVALVAINDLRDGGVVDSLEQAAAKNLHRLVVLGRVQQGRLACRDALRLGHLIGDELVLGRVGVARLAVLAHGEGIDERGMR